MTEKDRQIEFKVGDRVTSLDTNEKGTISSLCAYKNIIYVMWDGSNMPRMVETKALKRGG